MLPTALSPQQNSSTSVTHPPPQVGLETAQVTFYVGWLGAVAGLLAASPSGPSRMLRWCELPYSGWR
jgi:hypothetical protein